MSTSAPTPEPGRWKPLRIGLVDLFLYDAQEFRFRDGRLLIRGDNGSGKSKVLALTLPLLLDASLAPQRVEPDADRGKRMSWNLLQGGEYDERTGYSWIEFGRIDEHGDARFVTLGLGMKAVAGRDQLRHWWFTTSLRMGEGFRLVERTRTVLTRDRLEAVLGEHGRVHDTAEAYRRDVDGLLFGLGEQRYGALVDLLVHLRQPQLSKRPDEKALAAALQEALQPLGQDVVDDVAQAFQSLEEDRRQLEDLRAAATAVRTFTTEYAAYARVAAARAAATLRGAQSAVDRAQRTQRETSEAQQIAADSLEAAREAALSAQDEVVRLRARSEELRDLRSSDAYVQLEQLGRELRAAERERDEAEQEVDRAEQEVARAVDQAVAEASAETAAGAALATTTGGIEDAASRAGVTPVPADPAGLQTEGRRREEQVAAVRAALAARGTAERLAADARRRADEAQSRLDAATEQERAAGDAAAAARSSWLAAVRTGLIDAIELRGDDTALLGRFEAAAAWVEEPEGENPLLAWAADVREARAARLVEARVAAEGRRDGARHELAVLAEERTRLESAVAIEPPVPHTRLAARSGRAGAPFWRSVDFAADVGDAARAGLEGALEAAGLLDAWVPADGGAVEIAGDVVLVPAELTGPTLADVLVPAGDDVRPDAVQALLRSVGLGVDAPAAVAVDPTGRFRAGPARGRFAKSHAAFIGEVARERTRAARLVEIEADEVLARLEEQHADEAVRAAAARSARLADEFRSLPSDGALRIASSRARDAARTRERAADAVDETTGAADAAQTVLRKADDDVVWIATDLRLPAEPQSLDAVAASLRELLALVPLLVERTTALADAGRRARQAGDRETAARAALDRRVGARDARRTALLAAAERRATAEQSVGVEVRELDQRIRASTEALRDADEKAERARDAVTAASRALGVADGRADDAARGVEEAVAARLVATEDFRGFASTGLLRVIDPELEVPDARQPWAPDPSVRLARRIATRDEDLDPMTWDRVQNRLQGAFEVLGRSLSVGGREAFRETRHGLAVILVQLGPRVVAPDDLAAELEAEVAAREGLLTAREREVLENHLLDEVAATLQTLMQAADRQVAAMNAELESRPTSSGLRIRIAWRPVEDTGLDQARRRLLLRTAAAWSPADRAAIGDFLQHRIQAERAADPEATWHDRLTVALDYRAWNRFVVELHQNGAWRPASGPASGGERVLAASVPLFAAASAHYGSAAPHAPRLILLDEAFAGVDDRSRASYLGLLATFDLDVVMTSEREWAAYPEVPGIGIANLTRMGDLRAVHVDHWEWDGAARTRVADPEQSAVAEPDREPEGAALDLFGERR